MPSKFSIIPADACFDDRITAPQLRTLAALGWYGGSKDSGCWPSLNALCKQLQVGKRVLIRNINQLVACGYVERTARFRKDGSQSSNTYRVILDTDFELTPGDSPDHPPGADNATVAGGPAGHPSKENNKTEQQKRIYKPVKMTLQDWELKVDSQLCPQMMQAWIQQKSLCPKLVADAIEEFRTKMKAGGNVYADFKAAFQNYVNSGYLSKKLSDLARKADASGVRMTPGVSI